VRYFTPERLVRLQDHSDERRFLAALEEWEAAVAAYREQLHRIQEALPAGLRHLVNTVALHDARVIDLSRGQRSRFTIILQPESDPSRQVVLAYSLVEPVEIIEDALPEAARSQPLQWLYDELEDVQGADNSSQRERSGARTFLHSILLSNGWEVKLRFGRVNVTRPVSLLQRLPECGIAS
jgi:hypothetical protein